MISQRITIINKLGLHARAANKFVDTAAQFASRVEVTKDKKSVDGKSIMSIMLLAAAKGDELELRVEGDDEQQAFAAISDLIARRFDEDE